jgi:hypothetical protein
MARIPYSIAGLPRQVAATTRNFAQKRNTGVLPVEQLPPAATPASGVPDFIRMIMGQAPTPTSNAPPEPWPPRWQEVFRRQ